MTEFVLLILWLAFGKLLDTLFNVYQVKVQYDVEKARIDNETESKPKVQAEAESDKAESDREIGFYSYGDSLAVVEEDD